MDDLLARWEEIVEEFRRRRDRSEPAGKRAWTRRATAIAVLVGALFGVAALTGLGWLYVIDALLMALLVVSILLARWDLRGIGVRRQVPTTVFEGEEVPVRLVLKNDSGRTKLLLELRDRFPAAPPDEAEKILLVDHAPAGGHAARRYQARAYKRGRYTCGPAEVRSGGPFGLLFSGKEFELDDELLVYPRIEALSRFPVVDGASSPRPLIRERARLGDDQQVRTVREFHSGDPRRTIHWRSTARTGGLMVKQFEKQQEVRVNVVLDTRGDQEVGEGRETNFEYAVRAAASLLSRAFEEGYEVALTWDAGDGPRDRRPQDRWEGLTWLAELAPIGDASLAQVLDHLDKEPGDHGTPIVLLPYPRRDDLIAIRKRHRQGRSLLTVLCDPGTFRPFAPSVAPLAEELRSAGVRTCVLVQGEAVGARLSRL